ncbi:MAG: PucC family protein [Woeseiaceae bacterium]|jgi:MFS transporter, BCD family, chlorophyll transporter
MKPLGGKLARAWTHVGPRMLPFADVATDELPLGRLLRLSLFQGSVGMAVVLLTGTLNRVMIVELAVPAWLVASMVSLPLFFAPFRALVGFRSDAYRSALGWRRVPFIWFGSLMQFGGLAIMPFALLVLSGDTHGPVVFGQVGAALAFLLVGAGMHTTQTAGLALATDLARPDLRPRIVALLFVTLLVGMLVSALVFGWLLADFTQLKLIKVVQGAAVVTMVLNGIALWKQEVRRPDRVVDDTDFRKAWRTLMADPRAGRLLAAVALGTAGFTMQDILLEPYGGQILGMSVSQTTSLTALLAAGMLVAFVLAARRIGTGMDPHRLAAYGATIGIAAFTIVTFVTVLQSPYVFGLGVALIGVGSGLFAVGTLTAAMDLAQDGNSGIALGAWGAVQATAAGVAIAAGGILRDFVDSLVANEALGPALTSASTGYAVVYQIEVVLLFATLVAIGPLAAFAGRANHQREKPLGLAQFPS